ncbi:MAG: helix-turn-helix transcriptional regulator [Leptolyngbya sp. SIOISBB]|nr:helix-turn-helix transcriptional regulator [Leptolyngbya sp. SIOISBB]
MDSLSTPLTHHHGYYARITKALDRIHRDFATPLTVEILAEAAHMSISAFHRAFKQVTEDSPLQYLKKIRLNKAKSLIVHEGIPANVAATRVGYESASQFSREFKRYFNVVPSQAGKIGYAQVQSA